MSPPKVMERLPKHSHACMNRASLARQGCPTCCEPIDGRTYLVKFCVKTEQPNITDVDRATDRHISGLLHMENLHGQACVELPKQISAMEHELTVQTQHLHSHCAAISRVLDDINTTEQDVAQTISACRKEVRAIAGLQTQAINDRRLTDMTFVENMPSAAPLRRRARSMSSSSDRDGAPKAQTTVEADPHVNACTSQAKFFAYRHVVCGSCRELLCSPSEVVHAFCPVCAVLVETAAIRVYFTREDSPSDDTFWDSVTESSLVISIQATADLAAQTRQNLEKELAICQEQHNHEASAIEHTMVQLEKARADQRSAQDRLISYKSKLASLQEERNRLEDRLRMEGLNGQYTTNAKA
ncbi:hypothetical protein ONZ51_g10282 [Trametes cubensis]|uniref:Uncharacterized protein n=1 Tax=Trametes cubensis TaxID=1111947 RepID=A0AAD7TJS9_9APHY|nr:hypothetical protein ONZ51_g10282 [Trametes cubensis]